MKTKELRIGNLIEAMYYNEDNEEVFEVVSILAIDGTEGDLMEHTYWFEGGTQEQYFDFNPIQLTEEWLLKFGFEKINHIDGYSFWSLKRKRNYNKPSIDIYDTCTRIGNNTMVKHCEYVYQLQNLYFALTGTELELNENN